MQPTLMTQPPIAPTGYTAPPVPLPAGPMPHAPRTRTPGRSSEIDSLLQDIPSQQKASAVDADPELMLEPGPGIFMGLRVALMFNAGLGVAALLVYEAWSMLAH